MCWIASQETYLSLQEKIKQISLHVRFIELSCVLVVHTLLLGCSNREIYDAIQMNQWQECQRLPPAQYEDCMESLGGSYDSYELERRALEEPGETS